MTNALVDQAEADRLRQQFVDLTMKRLALEAVEKFKAAKAAIGEKQVLIKQLDAMAPDGRKILLPLLEHPDLAVRSAAGVYLLRQFPEQTMPVLQRLANMSRHDALNSPHWRDAEWEAGFVLGLYRTGELNV